MINTDEPSCASEIAVLTTVVDLPSPGCALVTSTILGGLPAAESSIEVRTTRYASAADERLSMTERPAFAATGNARPARPGALPLVRPLRLRPPVNFAAMVP